MISVFSYFYLVFTLVSISQPAKFDGDFDLPKWNSRVGFTAAICYLSLALMPVVWNMPKEPHNNCPLKNLFTFCSTFVSFLFSRNIIIRKLGMNVYVL